MGTQKERFNWVIIWLDIILLNKLIFVHHHTHYLTSSFLLLDHISLCKGGVSNLPVWQPSPVQPGRHRQVFQRIQVPP